VTPTTTPGGPPSGPGPQAPLLGVSPATVRRALAWGLLAVVAAYVTLRLVPLAPRVADLASEGLLSVVVGLALIALFSAFRHATGVERRFWALACAAAFLLLIGRVHDLLALSVTLPDGVLAAGWSGLFDVLAVVTLLTLLLIFSRFRHSSAAARARYVVDVAAVSLVVVGMLEAWVVGPWLDGLAVVSVWSRIVYSASPVVGGIAVVGMLRIVVGTRFDRWERWERMLAGAVAVLAMGLVLAPIAFADGVGGIAGGWVRSILQLLWMTGAYLGFVGAMYRRLDPGRPWRLRPFAALEPSYGWLPTVLLPSVEVLSLPLLGLAAAQTEDPSVRLLRLVVVGAIAITIAARTLLTVMDTDALTAGVVTDPLTGLYNHRHYQLRLDQEIAHAVRYGEGMSLAVFDVDDFARVNAAGGHAAGDEMLARLAHVAERAVRTRDVFCRTGGDEAAIILPATDPDTALAIAERVLAEARGVIGPNGSRMTASAGIASLPEQASERSELVGRAEAALYWAKTHGKDRAVVFDPALAFDGGVEERVRDLRERADLATVRALAAAVDARDEETQDHSRNVARYARALAQELGLDEATALRLEYAGLLHDVGKIGVPDAVLRKHGPLTADERECMEAHVALGEAILASTTMREILPLVRHHHERWDGTGYPDKLAGEGIPVGARILALANAYDAMRSTRPHRAGLSRSAALQEIDLGLGTAFDPELGERFIDAIGRTYL
jgi:diguanylate cyclase (GGDEF)-like protein/putative nucleotidyltransferase with HDIG domain